MNEFSICPSCQSQTINLNDGCGVCGWTRSQSREDKFNGEISSLELFDAELFLEDKCESEISSRNISDSSQFLEDKCESEISSRKKRRRKGAGSGCIYWRTVTKKGKDYQEAYYQYEFWKKGDRLVKSSKYIPKRLLDKVQELDAEKAPVREILKLLGVTL